MRPQRRKGHNPRDGRLERAAAAAEVGTVREAAVGAEAEAEGEAEGEAEVQVAAVKAVVATVVVEAGTKSTAGLSWWVLRGKAQ